MKREWIRHLNIGSLQRGAIPVMLAVAIAVVGLVGGIIYHNNGSLEKYNDSLRRLRNGNPTNEDMGAFHDALEEARNQGTGLPVPIATETGDLVAYTATAVGEALVDQHSTPTPPPGGGGGAQRACCGFSLSPQVGAVGQTVTITVTISGPNKARAAAAMITTPEGTVSASTTGDGVFTHWWTVASGGPGPAPVTFVAVDQKGNDLCSGGASFMIASQLSASLSGLFPRYQGDTAIVHAEAVGGLPPYTFSWAMCGQSRSASGSFTVDSQSVDNVQQPSCAVTCVVTDSSSQQASASGSFAVLPANLAVRIISRPLKLAPGESGTWTAMVTNAAAGLGPYSFVYNFGNGSMQSVVSASSQASASASYGSAGVYAVTVTVTAGEASGSVASSVSVEGEGNGCDFDVPVACGEFCYPAGAVCCPGGGACPAGMHCCSGSGCCPDGQECCGSGCCAPGSICYPAGPACCPPGYPPCGTGCCPPGSECVGGTQCTATVKQPTSLSPQDDSEEPDDTWQELQISTWQ